jgi:hypothetical protein
MKKVVLVQWCVRLEAFKGHTTRKAKETLEEKINECSTTIHYGFGGSYVLCVECGVRG